MLTTDVAKSVTTDVAESDQPHGKPRLKGEKPATESPLAQGCVFPVLNCSEINLSSLPGLMGFYHGNPPQRGVLHKDVRDRKGCHLGI